MYSLPTVADTVSANTQGHQADRRGGPSLDHRDDRRDNGKHSPAIAGVARPEVTMPDVAAQLEAATTRVKELSDQVAAQAKENGLAWLEGYEKILMNMLDLEEQAAKQTGMEWATTLATTHANFVRETSEVFFSTLTKQLKS